VPTVTDVGVRERPPMAGIDEYQALEEREPA
jgi:hypothetical protein